MKRHPSFDQLRELDSRARDADGGVLVAHVGDCLSCRETIDWVDQVRQGARRATTLPAPAQAWENISARIRSGESIVLPVNATPLTVPRSGRRMMRVAVAALLVASVVAAAVPGSPVRRWLHDALVSTPGPAAPITPLRTAPVAPAEPVTVLLVEPYEGTVTIVLEQPAPGSRLRVRVTEAGAVEVRASAGAAGAQFRSGNGRLTISGAPPGEFTLTIPRSLARVRVEVNGSVYLSKDRGQLHIFAPVADTVGSEIVLPITR
jgi:hypothetical protein